MWCAAVSEDFSNFAYLISTAMALNYEDIVREWYNRLRPAFMRKLTQHYPSLSLGDAENLYQDTFIAIYDNLLAERVREDTCWSNYIITIGLNLANKEMRRTTVTDYIGNGKDYESKDSIVRKAEQIMKDMPDEELPLSDNLEVQSLLGNELTHTPEPCASIIKFFYYENMSMEEIAEEIGYRNAQTAKAKKSQCMTDLIKRVTDALNRAGFDIKPKKRNRNGKN